jgi:hypothetical protein
MITSKDVLITAHSQKDGTVLVKAGFGILHEEFIDPHYSDAPTIVTDRLRKKVLETLYADVRRIAADVQREMRLEFMTESSMTHGAAEHLKNRLEELLQPLIHAGEDQPTNQQPLAIDER